MTFCYEMEFLCCQREVFLLLLSASSLDGVAAPRVKPLAVAGADVIT